MSAILFHGPGAREAALQEALVLGRLVVAPFGDECFGVEDARDVVRLIHFPQAVDKLGVLVVGLDHAAPKTQDVLLKILEDHDPTVTRILLWAKEAENISGTVRSRCLARWCFREESEKPLSKEVQRLVKHLQSGELAEALQIVLDHKGQEVVLLDTLSDACLQQWGSGGKSWWNSLRPVCELHNPTNLEVISALMGAGR